MIAQEDLVIEAISAKVKMSVSVGRRELQAEAGPYRPRRPREADLLTAAAPSPAEAPRDLAIRLQLHSLICSRSAAYIYDSCNKLPKVNTAIFVSDTYCNCVVCGE